MSELEVTSKSSKGSAKTHKVAAAAAAVNNCHCKKSNCLKLYCKYY